MYYTLPLSYTCQSGNLTKTTSVSPVSQQNYFFEVGFISTSTVGENQPATSLCLPQENLSYIHVGKLANNARSCEYLRFRCHSVHQRKDITRTVHEVWDLFFTIGLHPQVILYCILSSWSRSFSYHQKNTNMPFSRAALDCQRVSIRRKNPHGSSSQQVA